MSPDSGDLQNRLEDILHSVGDMLKVLQREAEVLGSRDAVALQSLSEHKENLARHINQQTAALGKSLADNGLPPMAELAVAVRGSGKTGAQLDATWQKIATLAKQCEELNDLNGAYVGLLRQHVQRSLDALHDRPAQDVTYGPDGVGQRPATSRKLLSV